MEVCNPKGGRTAAPASILTMLIMIMMLLNAYCCGAAVLAKSNISFRCSGGRLDECLIEEDLELELGFLISPYVSRILDGTDKRIQSSDPKKPAACGNSKDPYDKCIAQIKNPKNNGCTKGGYYKRCGDKHHE